MNENYLSLIAESKAVYHKKRAKMSYEEKLKVIVELQKIECEMIKSNKKRKSGNKLRNVWQINRLAD